MAKNDYHVRNLYWKTMKNNERFWLIASIVMLALLVAAIILDGTNTLDIPSWAIIMWVPIALYAVLAFIAFLVWSTITLLSC